MTTYVTDVSVIEFASLFNVLLHEREFRRYEERVERGHGSASAAEEPQEEQHQGRNKVSLRKLGAKNPLRSLKSATSKSLKSWRSRGSVVSSSSSAYSSSAASKSSKGFGWVRLRDEKEKSVHSVAEVPCRENVPPPTQFYWAVPIIF